MKRFRQTGVLSILIAGWLAAPAGAQVLNDPLQGSTTGVRAGGTFVPGGWRVDNEYDSIYWHVPVLSHGAFEYDIVGLPDQNCPGSGINSKNEISHMYDYTFGNADVNYNGGYRDAPYKQFLRKQCAPANKQNTMEILWDIVPNFLEDDTPPFTWDVNTVYHFRLEWQNVGGNSIAKTYRNGVLLWSQSLPGSWNPGGLSVRIAASTRRGDEGAAVGSIYSNVKVWDLNAASPNPPTVTAPANGETVNTALVFIQWSGDPHTQYQVRINAANSPDAATVWDSQLVNSDLNYAWTGILSNNATYYVFVRVGSGSGGLSPWSAAGRTFTVNTAFVPPGPNLVRVNGTTLADNNGPFLGLGATYMRALQRTKYDRGRFQSDCALLASKGFNYIRALSMVSWNTLEIAPVSFNNDVGAFVAAWPDYDQQLKDMLDIAYGYGLRTEITIFAGAQYVMPSDSTRMAHLDRVLADIAGREQKVILLEVANEHYANGLPDINDVRAKGQYLAARTNVPVALSSSDTSDAGIIAMNAGSAADIATVHFSRDNSSQASEGGWLPVRDCYRAAHLPGVPPVSSNEPIGAGSSVSTELDPLKLGSAAFFAFIANLPEYVYHSRAGVYGWTGCCPISGAETPFATSAGIDAYVNVRTLLSPDVSSWVRNDGLESTAPFTVFCNGQANKYWPDVPGASSGCDRNIGGIKGGEFVCYPMGILGGGLTLQARRPVYFTAYNPLTGAAAYSVSLTTGEQVTLAQGPGAYLIKGILTDIVGPLTEVSIDLGSPDVSQGLVNPQVGDGDTTPDNIGGRACRRNINPAEDYYFYFAVADNFAYQASKPDLYLRFDYYDAGAGAISLQYDSNTGGDIPAFYKNAGSVPLTNTNTWKRQTVHLTDAYFGNRQNGGADFRIAGNVGATFYLDVVRVMTELPTLPAITNVTPDPGAVRVGQPYSKQLTLVQGSNPITWSLPQAPPSAQVSSTGLVSWTPAQADLAQLRGFTAKAANSEGEATESWQILVLSRKDFDGDGDIDQTDFGHFQSCLAGTGVPYLPGCADADLSGDGSIDQVDFGLFTPCVGGPGHPPGC